jgi:hypothetical protein
MKKVSVSNNYMSLLRDYSDRTGISVARRVSDALSDGPANVAPLALGHASQEPPSGVTRCQT